jgi:dihydrofolate synthase/folylpolyglutamate synthase|tara:strand:- start:18570 stop:19817 length:1248 start_codon:yes stop_codon:yes gene_type:complete
LTLDEWLHRIENLHPVKWDLGIERVGEVAKRLAVVKPAPIVFLVAGTNGKGSTSEYLERFCLLQGKRVGKATSPHLLRFNERIVIDGKPSSDEEICSAFAAIDQVRGEISLTYFEYAALAALLIFRDQQVEVAVLEVGLGGRLDAMNLVEPDVSVITQIAMDHETWLGSTLDEIAAEKAGVMRRGKPCVIAEPTPPESILLSASEKECELYVNGEHFTLSADAARFTSPAGESLHFDKPGNGHLPADSAAAAIQALICAGFLLHETDLQNVIRNTRLPGRLQWLEGERHVLLDVAHNPNAATYLRSYLQSVEDKGAVHAVVAMYADKDCEGVLSILNDCVEHWHLASMDEARGATAAELCTCLTASSGCAVSTYDKIADAYSGALAMAGDDDLVLVFGSFPLVAAVLQLADRITK